ncbi:MAG: SLC13 family permease [Bacilli bacterium]
MKKILYSIWNFEKQNIVMMIALLASIITAFFVPIDKEYLNYLDLPTLACLFSTLLVICGFNNIHFFEKISRAIVLKFKNTRNVILALVFTTYIGSMILANDMALITFLPLGIFIMRATGKKKYLAFTFIMQNIAANLGGMVTPFGNPQNIYLFSYFNINTLEFIKIMGPPFLLSFLLILICIMFVKKEELVLIDNQEYNLPKVKTVFLSLLFVAAVLLIFKVVPFYYALAVVVVGMLIVDYKAFMKVDYGLLFTFLFFFIFTGNLSRIESISTFFSNLISHNTLIVSVLTCQFISNVPTAILFSKFTLDYPNLLVAVNIGGIGTIVASLASLITFSQYRKEEPKKAWQYLGLFSLINFLFLGILIIFQLLIN